MNDALPTFTAWLAMDRTKKRATRYFAGSQRRDYVIAYVMPPEHEQGDLPVLIVADTPENRKRLGMKASS